MTKFYVNDTNKTTIVCPKCGFAKTIDTTNFKETQKQLKANCKCGEAFKFTLEFRKHYRKDVRLPGEYTIQQSGEKGEIMVENLSLGGVQFTSFRPHKILTDDTLELKFNLDNPARTEIRRSAKVMWVRDRDVGARYIEPKLFERDLSFYLRA
ncbi:MAG: PilZ domain-containing protein [Proteobacteria bacterium]|nr:PilZ domain-containing protein [Pseudomonadota bacterium]